MNKSFIILLFIFNIKTFALNLDLDDLFNNDILYLKSTTELMLMTDSDISIYIIKPVKANYSNITESNKIELQEIKYRSELINKKYIDKYILKFDSGIYYITKENYPVDFKTSGLLHLNRNTIQIVVRDEDSLHGYLSELFNTPFINTPLRNSNGLNQADNRVGSDCASFVTYGLRRMGKKIPYTNPIDFVSFIHPIDGYWYYPKETDTGLYEYKNQNGLNYKISTEVENELILSFNDHIAVFYEDKGIFGILDSEDLVIQSWFDGPGIVRLRDNGFFGYPIKLYDPHL